MKNASDYIVAEEQKRDLTVNFFTLEGKGFPNLIDCVDSISAMDYDSISIGNAHTFLSGYHKG